MRRLLYLDGVRGIGVILVMMFHLGYWEFGFTGVELFFVLSGYIISLLLVNEFETTGEIDLRSFYRRRISRLYPVLFLVLLGITWLSINFPIPSIQDKIKGELIYGSLGVANWFDYFRTTGYWEQGVQTPSLHLWSLSIEFQFYLIWPVLMSFLFKWKQSVSYVLKASLLIYVISLLLIIIWSMIGIKSTDYYNTFLRSPSFILGGVWGMASSLKRNKIKDLKRPTGLIPWLLFLFLVLLTTQFRLTIPNLYVLYIPLYTISAGGLFYVMSLEKERTLIKKVLESRLLLFFGRISYVLYLVHMPVIVYLTNDVIGQYVKVNKNGVAIIQVLVSIGLSVLIHQLIEKKIQLKTLGKGLVILCAMPLALYWIQQQSSLFRVVEPRHQIEEKWIESQPVISKGEGASILVIGDSWSRRTGLGLSLATTGQNKSNQILTYGVGNASLMDPDYFISSTGDPVHQAKTFEGYIRHWKKALEIYHPKYVVMQFGNADQSRQLIENKKMRVGSKSFDTRFISQYTKLIEMVSGYDTEIIIMNVIHNDYDAINTMDNTLSDAMNKNIKKVIEINPETNLFDLNQLLENPRSETTVQEVKDAALFDETNHPSYMGSLYIGEQLLEYINELP